ncbi:MAG: YjbQ family protein [Saprospiraceae bacterium]|nr:YjbQ family protein [Saprospiraceae bacterium]
MEIITKVHHFRTVGHTAIINLTDEIQTYLMDTGLSEGQVTVFGIGSTTGITTIEYEPGLVDHDISEMFEKISPYAKDYVHNRTWGDDNGAAHVRSFLTGTHLVCPIVGSRLVLGTWQQIVFVDFDTRPRERKVVIQFMGK